MPDSDKAIYVVYGDDSGSWRVQAVPVSSESFDSRKALPEAWRGLRDDTLSAASGIEGCVFVHASGFIGGTLSLIFSALTHFITRLAGNKTKEGAMQLAKAALEM